MDNNRKLNKPFRTPKGPKKFAVYVKDPKSGNIKIVRFGDPEMEIKRDDPKRRKAFRDRHSCDEKKDKTKPGYWSCKFWSGKSVTELLAKSSSVYNVDLTDWDGRTFWPEEEIAPYFKNVEVEESIADESHDYHLDITPEMMKELHEKGRIEVTVREGNKEMVIMFTYKSDGYHHYEEGQAKCGADHKKASEAAKISAQVEKALKKKVKEHSISVLKEIINAIEENNFSLIKKHLVFSPAGDCMGYDNTFIDFGKVTGSTMDIEDLVYYLTGKRLDIKR